MTLHTLFLKNLRENFIEGSVVVPNDPMAVRLRLCLIDCNNSWVVKLLAVRFTHNRFKSISERHII